MDIENMPIRKLYSHRIRTNIYKIFNPKKIKINPYAFIRVKNEKTTIEQSLNSILPVIKRGIIAYHKLTPDEKDDGTLLFLEDFIKKNPGYKLVYYPHIIFPPAHERYKDLSTLPTENRLEGFYNFALSHIPPNEWLLKIDCDQIYDSEKLSKILTLPHSTDDMVTLPRLNLHYKNNKLYFIDKNVVYYGDHWLIYNKDLHFETSTGYRNNRFFAYENLVFPNKKVLISDLFTLHFPYMKNYRNISDSLPLEEYSFDQINTKEKIYYNISKNFFSKDNILAICKKFAL